MIEIDAAEARRLRARAHLIGGSALEPAAVVARAGALQGQDLGSVLRAIALRSASGTTVADVRAAFDSGALVRGWPMRGTLFAVTPADLAGFVGVTAPRMQASLRARRAYLGLSDADFELAKSVATAALAERPRSRGELEALWADAGVPQGQGLGYHFTSTLAIDGVLALGPFDGNDQIVVPVVPISEPEDAFLARIARAFFAARGPATLDDLAWWLKAPKGGLKRAIAEVEEIERVSVDGREMLRLDDGVEVGEPAAVVLVPGFDEWILGYADRSLTASDAVMKELATVNGIFRPAVLVDGVAVGRWSKGALELVERVTAKQRKAIDAALAAWPYV